MGMHYMYKKLNCKLKEFSKIMKVWERVDVFTIDFDLYHIVLKSEVFIHIYGTVVDK